MGASFQGGEIVAVKAEQPAIKGLQTDAEMPACARGVAPVKETKKHPLKPRSRCSTQTLSEVRQLTRHGKLIPSDLAHPDTLPSVTNHSERAQWPSSPTGRECRAVSNSLNSASKATLSVGQTPCLFASILHSIYGPLSDGRALPSPPGVSPLASERK